MPKRELSSFDLLQSALVKVSANLNKDQMIKILNAFHSKESELFSPLPAVVESLPDLINRGHRLCIVSNNPWSESIRASLRRHRIEHCFEGVIVSCDVGYRKPHREIFEEMQRQMMVTYSDILFVGDSYSHDIEMPKKMGMQTCLVDFEGLNKNNQKNRSKDSDLFLTRFDQLLQQADKEII